MLTLTESSATLPVSSLLRVYTRKKGVHWRSTKGLIYLEGSGSYTWQHWTDEPKLLIPHTLKSFISQLPANGFVRLHRCYLVNQLFIAWLERTPQGAFVHLTTGLILPVSRRMLPVLARSMRTWEKQC